MGSSGSSDHGCTTCDIPSQAIRPWLASLGAALPSDLFERRIRLALEVEALEEVADRIRGFLDVQAPQGLLSPQGFLTTPQISANTTDLQYLRGLLNPYSWGS